MKCLHRVAHSITQKGSFWFCNQNPSCYFFCSEDESYLYEKATAAWKSTKQPHPRCKKHGKLAKMHVFKNLLKSSYGQPFFVCSDQSNPCSFWVWSNVQHVVKPKCHHGILCVIRKVKKETTNKDRLFFCCAQKDSCNYLNGCLKNLITMLNPPDQKSTKMKNAKNNTQQKILSTISLA